MGYNIIAVQSLSNIFVNIPVTSKPTLSVLGFAAKI